MAARLWSNTFAATDQGYYWAVGTQIWFDAAREASPADGAWNEVNTRSELKAYDPALAALLAEYLPDDDWRWHCP